jgi:hypothetical protein
VSETGHIVLLWVDMDIKLQELIKTIEFCRGCFVVNTIADSIMLAEGLAEARLADMGRTLRKELMDKHKLDVEGTE